MEFAFDWAWRFSEALDLFYAKSTKYVSFVDEFPFLSVCSFSRRHKKLDKIRERNFKGEQMIKALERKYAFV